MRKPGTFVMRANVVGRIQCLLYLTAVPRGGDNTIDCIHLQNLQLLLSLQSMKLGWGCLFNFEVCTFVRCVQELGRSDITSAVQFTHSLQVFVDFSRFLALQFSDQRQFVKIPWSFKFLYVIEIIRNCTHYFIAGLFETVADNHCIHLKALISKFPEVFSLSFLCIFQFSLRDVSD